MSRRTFAVIGLGRFGSAIATTLTELGQEVIGIDGDEERVRALADVIHHAVELDATDERALRAAGVPDVDVAVVSIGENIEASLLVVMLVKELGVQTIYRQGCDAAARAHPHQARRDPGDLPGARDGRPHRAQRRRAERDRLRGAVARLLDRRAAGSRPIGPAAAFAICSCARDTA